MKHQPNTFYRYRAFNILTLDGLCLDTMYFANPSTFNDPLDCSPSVNCDSSCEELREILTALIRRRISAEIKESLNKARVRGEMATVHAEKRAASEASSALSRLAYYATNPDYSLGADIAEAQLLTSEIEDEIRSYYARGVCCFSTSYASPLLWSHYGDQHQGLCIGYGLDRNPLPSPQPVQYGGSRSITTSALHAAFVLNDLTSVQALDQAVLLRKARCWSYEREWRLIDSQGLQDSPMLLKDVTFGLRCKTSVMHAVVEALSRRNNVQFFEMYEVRGKYSLRRRALDLDELGASLPQTALSAIEMFPIEHAEQTAG